MNNTFSTFLGVALLGIIAYMVYFYIRLKRANKRADIERGAQQGKTLGEKQTATLQLAETDSPVGGPPDPEKSRMHHFGVLLICIVVLAHCYLLFRFNALTPCSAATDRIIEEYVTEPTTNPSKSKWESLGQAVGRGYLAPVLWDRTYSLAQEKSIFHCYTIAFGWSDWKPEFLSARN